MAWTRAGYEISDEGYGFKIYYIARAKVVVNDKTSDACGKVYVGGTGMFLVTSSVEVQEHMGWLYPSSKNSLWMGRA